MPRQSEDMVNRLVKFSQRWFLHESEGQKMISDAIQEIQTLRLAVKDRERDLKRWNRIGEIVDRLLCKELISDDEADRILGNKREGQCENG